MIFKFNRLINMCYNQEGKKTIIIIIWLAEEKMFLWLCPSKIVVSLLLGYVNRMKN